MKIIYVNKQINDYPWKNQYYVYDKQSGNILLGSNFQDEAEKFIKGKESFMEIVCYRLKKRFQK